MSDNRSQHEVEYLQRVPLFAGLATKDLEAAVAVASRHPVADGEFFFQQGEPATCLFVLTRGRCKVTQVTPEGHQVILRYVTPGHMFGAVAALGEESYPASAEAIGDSGALGWNGEAMVRLMEQHPPLAMNALRIISSRLQELQQRYRELATERVERRIARALLRLARQTGRKVEHGVLIDLTLSRQDLAEMTGTTLYTVSRTLSQWEQQGLVEAGRERVVIRFPHGLVTIAEDLPGAADAAE